MSSKVNATMLYNMTSDKPLVNTNVLISNHYAANGLRDDIYHSLHVMSNCNVLHNVLH